MIACKKYERDITGMVKKTDTDIIANPSGDVRSYKGSETKTYREEVLVYPEDWLQKRQEYLAKEAEKSKNFFNMG